MSKSTKISGTANRENVPPSRSSREKSAPSSEDYSGNGPTVEPLNISSARELDELVRLMLPAFEGRESETNWNARERHINTLRRLTQGNAPSSFPTHFVNTIKNILDDIFKVVNSLRTTLCTTGCILLQELVRRLGPKADPWIDIMLNNLLKLCANMKKLSSQAANETIIVVISNVSYSTRLLTHIVSAATDKNVQVRLHAASWMREVILKQAHNPASIEHGNGLGILNQAIRKGLSDANPGVREAMRKAFWTFAETWPQKALETLNDLDPKSRSLLERDPANPSASTRQTAAASNTGAGIRATATRNKTTGRTTNTTTTTTGRTTMTRPATAAGHALASESTASTRSAPTRPASSAARHAISAPDRVSKSEASNSSRSANLTRGTAAHGTATSRSVVTSAATASGTTKSVSSSNLKTSSLSSAPLRPKIKRTEQPHTAPNHVGQKTATLASTISRVPQSPISKPLRMPSTPPSHISSPSISSKVGSARSKIPVSPRMASTMRATPKTDVSSPSPASNKGLFHSKVPISPGIATASKSRDANNSRRPMRPAPLDMSKITSPASSVSAIGSPLELPSPLILDATDGGFPPNNRQGHSNIVETSASPHKDNLMSPLPLSSPALISEQVAEEGVPCDLNIESLTQSYNDVDPENRNLPSQPQSLPAPVPGQAAEEVSASTEPPYSASAVSSPKGTAISPNSKAPSPNSKILIPIENASSPNSKNSSPTLKANHAISSPDVKASSPKSGASSPEVKASSPKSSASSQNKVSPRTEPSASPKSASTKQTSDKVPLRRVIAGRLSMAQLIFTDDTAHRRWVKIEAAAHRRAIMPRTKDPEEARQLLAKGITGIRNQTIDILGYRHLQGLIAAHDRFFKDEPLYDELLFALFEELERPTEEKTEPLGRPFDIKTQVLMTLRFMFRYGQLYFKAFYPRAMAALVNTRRNYDDKAHIVSGLIKSAFDIAEVCDPEDVVESVLDFIDSERCHAENRIDKLLQDPVTKTKCDRSMLFGIQILGHLLWKYDNKKVSPPQQLIERIGWFAGKKLNDEQSPVRQAAIDLCLQLYTHVRNEQRFFKILGSPRETYKNLLTYYIARLE